MNTLNTALNYHGKGIATIPLRPRDKRPLFSWRKFQKRLPTLNQLAKWFIGTNYNIAVVTGWQNLVVLDFDIAGVYEWWQAWATYEPGAKPALDTYKVKTKRGIHVYLYVNDPPKRTIKLPGIDIKANGYVLAPPSVHPSGHIYQTYKNGSILHVNSICEVIPTTLLESTYAPNLTPISVNSTVVKKPESVWHVPPPATAEEVKEKVQILSIVPSVRQTGRHWHMAFCPLHEDKRPSMWINTKANRCGCNACYNGSMDVIELYARMNNVSNAESIRQLGELV